MAVFALFTSQSSLEPYTAKVQCGEQAGLFALLDDPVSASGVGIGELKLYRYPGSDISIADFLGFQNLEHNDVAVSHGAVVNQIVFPHQRTALIHKNCIFLGHENLLWEWGGGFCRNKSPRAYVRNAGTDST